MSVESPQEAVFICFRDGAGALQEVSEANPLPMSSSGGSAPTGPAGGDLAGTYPDPTVANTANLSVQSVTTPIVRADVYANADNTFDLAHNTGSTFQINSGVDVSAVVNTAATDTNFTSDGQGFLTLLGNTTGPRMMIGTGPDVVNPIPLLVYGSCDPSSSFIAKFLDATGNGFAIYGTGEGAPGPIFQAGATGTNDISFFWQPFGGNAVFGAFSEDGTGSKLQVVGDLSVLTGVIRTGSFTLGTLPDATAYTTGIIMVSDATGGQVLCFSDGSNWISVKTGVPVA